MTALGLAIRRLIDSMSVQTYMIIVVGLIAVPILVLAAWLASLVFR